MASERLAPYLKNIRIPSNTDRIHKDECIFSYDTPNSPDGIYVCMKTFLGFSRQFAELFHKRTGNSVFLNLRRIAHPIIQVPDSDDDVSKPKVTRLALNVEGGFQTNQQQFKYEEINTIVLMPGFVEIPLNQLNQMDLPDVVVMSLTGILSADSASRQAELEAMKNTWDGEKRIVSKHAENLLQLDNGVKVSTDPSSWKCQKCDIREGLWLNLTDGSIHCGRKYFDGTGGNNHAEEYYKETKYPLVVKLGTITSQGADVYSYDEDSMVDDPRLVQHLAHFGIHVAMMLKTEKSMLEMEIDLNQRYDEWRIIQEDGSHLKQIFGAGFTGMANLGNSCYLNSIMQVLFSIPDFISSYYRPLKSQQFLEANHNDPINDLRTQIVKLSCGLLSGEYSTQSRISPSEQLGIKPSSFKNLIGRNHPEFNTKRQQDAQEFLLHVIDVIERLHTGPGQEPPTNCFKFEVEERMQCETSRMVKYKRRSDFLLSLPIQEVPIQNQQQYDEFLQTKAAVEAAGGKIENDQVVRPIVKMVDCFNAFAHDVQIADFYSSAIKGKTTATQRIRMRTFPDYLIIHMKKFAYDETFTPKKLDVCLEVPHSLDLEYLRATGLMPGEKLLPEDDTDSTSASSAGSSFVFNEEFLLQLKDMGFDENGCRRALYYTKNAGVEPAMNWIFEHMNDPDFSATFEVPQPGDVSASQPVTVEVDPEAFATLLSMGMDERAARLGLKLNNNNTEQAVSWIFNNATNMDAIERQEEERVRAAALRDSSIRQVYRDGISKYELFAMVSHMGPSTLCGHYVAHIRKPFEKETVIYNPVTKETLEIKDGPANISDGSQSPAADPLNQESYSVGNKEWIIFNDNKVNISEKPPIPFAYIYVYKRKGA